MRITPKQAESLATQIRRNPGRGVLLDEGDSRDIVATFDGQSQTPVTIGGRGKVQR